MASAAKQAPFDQRGCFVAEGAPRNDGVYHMTDSSGSVNIPIELVQLDALLARVPNLDRPPDPKLTAEGWERRFMTQRARLAEYTDLYGSLGFDVRAESIRSDEVDPECSDCRLILFQQIVTIYTRKRSDRAAVQEGGQA